MFFQYGEKETEYLRAKNRKLAYVIDRIGHVDRTVDTDLFSSVLHHIIGQQISTKAQTTIWNRLLDEYVEPTPQAIAHSTPERLQGLGISFRKADYIMDFSQKVENGEFSIERIKTLSDDEAIAELVRLKGIGVWTAEMILLFCLQRPDILSYGDLAIQRGMRMTFHHRKIDRELFEKYRRRFSPYNSVASLYFWAVSGGAVPELVDYAQKK